MENYDAAVAMAKTCRGKYDDSEESSGDLTADECGGACAGCVSCTSRDVKKPKVDG